MANYELFCIFAPMNYNTCVLSSGLRVIHLPSDSRVIYCGYVVHAGTRHELSGEEGLAHFCEHLAFKGTSRRSSVQILNAIEGVGGELNAFTGKEDTVYYTAITRQHLSTAVDVLTDIVFHSQYPQQEVEKEREVVCDEIESYEDSPAELIFDEFENILFEGHPLGHNILGCSEQVRTYTSDDARRFTSRHYRPCNAVFFASGDVDFKRLVKRLGSLFEGSVMGPAEERTVAGCDDSPSVKGEALHESRRGTHQAHVMIGTIAYPATDPRRWALYLLNNLLGGPSLNSRLNIALRERRGLVYTVESSMTCYSDTGLWSVYFGCDPADGKRCLRIVKKELVRLANQPLTEVQLNKAKQQLRGQLTIAADNREQFAIDFARSFLHEGRVRRLDEVLAHVDCLTSQQLQQTACELFAENRLVTLIYR